MAHGLEYRGGVVSMAYAGETPWHGLGKKVPSDLSPEQMMDAAGLGWKVVKRKLYADSKVSGKSVRVATDRFGLFREDDNRFFDVVSDEWQPMQNAEAFEFFNEFVEAGHMDMETAGSLRGGQIVWGMARVKESFEVVKGDVVESYLLFTNPHQFARSIDVRFTPTRVVCQNTLSIALKQYAINGKVRVTHRQKFNAERTKELLGIAREQLFHYKDTAQFLSAKRYDHETIVEYFKRIFPAAANTQKEMHRNAKLALEIMDSQPGAEYAPGSWWQAVNAATFLVDHVIGYSDERRLDNAWYGSGARLKNTAMDVAVEMATAA